MANGILSRSRLVDYFDLVGIEAGKVHAEIQSADLGTLLRPCNTETLSPSTVSGRMLNTEVLWNKALTDNNVRGIVCWLRSLSPKSNKGFYQHCSSAGRDGEESLENFRCWLHSCAEMTKKELLSLCFGQCQGLWMFLDQNAITTIHVLNQKLRNLLFLAHLEKPHNRSLRCGHSSRLTCWVRCGCCCQDQYMLRPYILLGQLVRWWSFTGLLPQYPDAHELKQISQMWREMDQNYKTACLELRCDVEDKYRWSSIIQGSVAHLDKKHGPLWASEDCSYQTYPPPSLEALLKLVLIPYIDIMSVQAIIMYFVLDVSNFLHCKDDLLESFCLTFSIPSSLSQQMHGLWLLDHGFVSDSMEILLSPRASSSWSSYHHRAVLRVLLRIKEQQSALKYLYYTNPATENIQDVRLYTEVLLQNNRISEALVLLRRGQLGNERLIKHLTDGCEQLGLSGKALAVVCKKELYPQLAEKLNSDTPDKVHQETQDLDRKHDKIHEIREQVPRPLSALLYQNLKRAALAPGDVVRLLREAVRDVYSLQKCTREVVVWPKNTEENRNVSLPHQFFHHISSFPTPVKVHMKPQRLPRQELEDGHLCEELTDSPSVPSSGCTSPDSLTSTDSFASAPSSPPAVNRKTSFRRASNLPLQNPFALPGDEDCNKTDEGHILSQDLLPCCPDLTLTVEGTAGTLSFTSLNRDSGDELIVSECGVEEILTCTVSENISEPKESQVFEFTDREKRSNSRFNLPPQFYSNEDNQAVPSPAEILVNSHNFLTPDYEKIGYDKAVSEDIIRVDHVLEPLSFLPPDQEEEIVHHGNPISAEPSESSSFLELKPLRLIGLTIDLCLYCGGQRALSGFPVEECLEVFRRNSQDAVDQPEILTSCALTETMQDVLGQIQAWDLSVMETEPSQPASLASLRNSILEMDFNPKRVCSRPHQLQIPLGASSSPGSSPTRSPQLSCSDQARNKSPGTSVATMEAACFRTSPDPVGHCKLGSWWKQALETRRASAGLLPAIEQLPALTKERITSLGVGKPQGITSFVDSSIKPKALKREAVKDETSSRRGSARASKGEQGAATHRGPQGKRRKKRVKTSVRDRRTDIK